MMLTFLPGLLTFTQIPLLIFTQLPVLTFTQLPASAAASAAAAAENEKKYREMSVARLFESIGYLRRVPGAGVGLFPVALCLF